MANPAPRRTGKHAAHPPLDQLAAERDRDLRIVQHIREGKSFDQAAQLEGLAHRSGAWRAFWRVVNRNEAREVDKLRAVQGEQIEAALAIWIPKMLEGDKDAAIVALRMWERQAKLFGLDVPARLIGGVADDIPDDPDERHAVILSLLDRLAAPAEVPVAADEG